MKNINWTRAIPTVIKKPIRKNTKTSFLLIPLDYHNKHNIFKLLFIFITIIIVATSNLAYASSSAQINEFMPTPSSGNDWVELYNPSDNQLDLANWVLKDNTSTMKTLTGVIPAKGFLVFEVSARLNKTGDTILLIDQNNNQIDSYTYSDDPGTDVSIGRSSDGQNNWVSFQTHSKGTANAPPSPSPSPSPSNFSNPSSPSPSPSTSFLITNTPQSIDSTNQFNATVSISNISLANNKTYLKGAFVKENKSNYFGLTKSNNSWIKNSDSYLNQYPITLDNNGSWNGILEVKPDTEDSGFEGSGEYIFKVGKYASTGSGPTWTNEVKILINLVSLNSPQPSSSPSSSPQSVQSTNKFALNNQTATNPKIKIASVAAASTESGELFISKDRSSTSSPEIKKADGLNTILLASGFGIIIVAVSFVYLKWQGYIKFL